MSFFSWIHSSSIRMGFQLNFWKINSSLLLKSGNNSTYLSGGWSWNSDNISSTFITNRAPCWISLFVPTDLVESVCPGKANTSRFWSKALRAVIMAPLFFPASMINTPFDRPLIIRFRLGKLTASGFVPGINSEIKVQFLITIPPSFRFSPG